MNSQKSIPKEAIPFKTKIAAWIMRGTGILLIFAFFVLIMKERFELGGQVWLVAAFSFFVSSLFFPIAGCLNSTWLGIVSIVFGLLFIILSLFLFRNKKQVWIISVFFYCLLLGLQFTLLVTLLAILINRVFFGRIVGLLAGEITFTAVFVFLPLYLLLSDRKFFWQKSLKPLVYIVAILVAILVLLIYGVYFYLIVTLPS